MLRVGPIATIALPPGTAIAMKLHHEIPTHAGAAELTSIQIAGTNAKLLRRPDLADHAPWVLHLHGGAYVSRPAVQSPLIARLLAAAGANVVSLHYPLAPQHPFPQPLEAAHEALCAMQALRGRLTDRPSPLLVAGEEAGGNLSAGLALLARDRGRPALAAQILLSPLLDPHMATASLRAAHVGHAGSRLAEGWRQYLARSGDAMHPYAAPLHSQRLGGLAPALIVTRQGDPLRDEAHAYADRLRNAGVRVHEHALLGDAAWPDGAADIAADPAWATPLRQVFEQFFEHIAPAWAAPASPAATPAAATRRAAGALAPRAHAWPSVPPPSR